ncbi:MAG: hypothetical protein KDI19_07845 [Pseudomonadales bacterium]|nr:hypothetical protein [Pseudomonadales bacterium]
MTALDYAKLRADINALYAREHVELGHEGTLRCLDEARRWDLSGTLADGGVVVFPHAGVADCGHQIGAAVNACLDSRADKVVVISVLHAFTDAMQQARVNVSGGDDPAKYPFWGIQGTGIPGDRQEWQYDHVLTSWRHLWRAETTRRGIRGPLVIERYPYLAGGNPSRLPGIEELARLIEDAVVVSTADAFHHGIGYGDTPETSFDPDADGLAKARARMQEGVDLLAAGNYAGYDRHCVEAKSDARDAGQTFRYLRGPMRGEILDVTYTDSSELYGEPPPTWVAGALFEWRQLPSSGA